MEVILVLGVMNGFQKDLRTKILDTQAHVVIDAPDGSQYFGDYRALTEKARTVEGVTGATPFLQTEVMITSPTNLQPALLKGVDISTVGQANRLPETVKEGRLEALERPELVKPFSLDDHPSLGDLPDGRDRARAAAGLDLEDAATPSAPDPELAAAGMEIPAPAAATAGRGVLPALLLGTELRRNLNLWAGERLNIVSPIGDLGPNGPIPKSRPFRVAGWFESGMLEFDTRLAYTSIGALQRYLGLEDVVGGIQVRVADIEQARAVRDRLRALLGDSVRVSDWQELNSNLFSALKLEKIAMFLVLSINILLAAFAITATLVMTIIERRRQVAILSAMGAHPGGIVRIFMSQGLFNGALGAGVGAALGLSLGLGLSAVQLPMDGSVYYLPNIPVDVRVVDVAAIVLVALAISVLSTIYPAIYAARLRPVEGLSAE
jgi:lipoprotein-releasing system permease protein